ncbi:NADPH-cytochrome P450 reductase [Apophysomyces sp. BC1034]|nr:NADPH-cytochrome P450 reductase [Apophysomyces sp. BC1015]KAG0182050.1 NADPH-cytochrome P450 reductase [Apophysomyces sp. BC1021]KAG0190971.1 NADPH-cytochrome P450 reductase [Apophysomyces sp. BC1034]
MISNSPVTPQHIAVFGTIGLGAITCWMLKQHLFSAPQAAPPKTTPTASSAPSKTSPNFVEIMKAQNRKIIIFYGSQTGTAEEFANRLAKECKRRWGVDSMVADLELHNLAYLDQLPNDRLAIFVMASYGEGEPTDNAIAFWDLLHAPQPHFSQAVYDAPLKNLQYLVFGLGNSTYTYFNGVARAVDEKLTALGATRLGERGEGDDDNSLEDDFIAWQEKTWPVLSDSLKVEETKGDTGHESNYIVENILCDDPYVGELGERAQKTWDAKKPFPAVFTSKDLIIGSDRHCLHLDIDISGSNLSYETGDHIGIWPTNNENEVTRVANIFGLDLNGVINVKAKDSTAAKQSPFPVPTTYQAMLRHYVDVCQLPSRQTLDVLVPFAPEQAQAMLKLLAMDKDEHRQHVLDAVRNLAQTLEYVLEKSGCTAEGAFDKTPAAILIECFGRLQPRYYSISSSSSESPQKISVTAVTLEYRPRPTPSRTVFGVNTNYLWSIHSKIHGEATTAGFPNYAIEGPKDVYYDKETSVTKLPVHLRRSNFKLPSDSSVPVIMIGPGTGVAPFRGFVRERVHMKRQSQEVGPTILFFGCRRSSEDFLYKDEWPALFSELGDSSRIITAFSREMDEKVYVQHRLKEHGTEMWKLISDHGAYIYVCGDARRMAKDVQQAFVSFAKQFGDYNDADAEAYIANLRLSGRYQEDVWA